MYAKRSRDARELQRCSRCYWYSKATNDPAFCNQPKDVYDYMICDEKAAIDCKWYIEKSEADKLIRGYCKAMAASPEIPEPEFGEDSVRVWKMDNNAYKLEAVEIQYEE